MSVLRVKPLALATVASLAWFADHHSTAAVRLTDADEGIRPGRPVAADPSTNGPFPRVAIGVRGKAWFLNQLYQTASDWLVKNKGIRDEVRTNATVSIDLDQKDVLCTFYFTYPKVFHMPTWEVEIGYDGGVKNCKQVVATDSHPPPKGVRVPPADGSRIQSTP
jgi:hypothetical protein